MAKRIDKEGQTLLISDSEEDFDAESMIEEDEEEETFGFSSKDFDDSDYETLSEEPTVRFHYEADNYFEGVLVDWELQKNQRFELLVPANNLSNFPIAERDILVEKVVMYMGTQELAQFGKEKDVNIIKVSPAYQGMFSVVLLLG